MRGGDKMQLIAAKPHAECLAADFGARVLSLRFRVWTCNGSARRMLCELLREQLSPTQATPEHLLFIRLSSQTSAARARERRNMVSVGRGAK